LEEITDYLALECAETIHSSLLVGSCKELVDLLDHIADQLLPVEPVRNEEVNDRLEKNLIEVLLLQLFQVIQELRFAPDFIAS
jgi:hypothetical protein